MPTGDVEIVLEYEQKPFRPFAETTGGTAKLSVNGKVVGNGEIPNVVIGRFSATETLDIGMDLGAVVVPCLSRPGAICIHGEDQGRRHRDLAHSAAD